MRSLFTAVWLASGLAAAQGVCSASELSSELQHLRRLTLDLAGRAPTEAELQKVVRDTRVDPATLDALLQPAVVKPMLRRLVRQQLQANLALPLSNAANLSPRMQPGYPDSPGLWVINRAQTYRKRPDGTAPAQVPCFDEPAAFDAQRRPIATLRADGYLREGWVEVRPYWDSNPAARVRVCAFDAQEAELAQVAGRMMRCDQHETAYLTRDCGCGPNLRLCQGFVDGVSTETAINAALVEQAMRLVDHLVDEGRPWSELLTGADLDVNGPLVHYLKFQTGLTLDFSSRGDLGFTLPDVPYTDATWRRVRLTGRASGVLTTPFFLLKFASNRARANQVFNAFLCTPLQASTAGLASQADAGFEPDLALRVGCRDCHQVLEPAAAAWGRYVERGTWELKDAEFPTFDRRCVSPDGGPLSLEACNTHYRTVARHPSELPFVGQLLGRLYLSPEGIANFDEGPRRWATRAVNDGSFAECTVQKLWEAAVGRPFNREFSDEQQQLDRLTTSFRARHDVRELLRAIVTSKQYRESERRLGGTP
jgi:hypothetical protein